MRSRISALVIPAAPTLLAALMFLALNGTAVAQDVPEPDGDPIDISEFDGADEDAESTPRDGKALAARRIVKRPTYYSPTLQGKFEAQWLKLTIRRRRVLFWGGRIRELDASSPLKQLGLQAGDVITRLDGVKVATGMFKQGGVWQMEELENHVNDTAVRFIIAKTKTVREGNVDLGTGGGGGALDP